ncbi:MAG: hypothetical protein GXO06_06345 [Epsilonproteobacteria bacterium]|nr:hypothetical protein [Campylobacterota bacterium]
MSRETWVAVAIFVSGVVGVALYWFYPDRVVEPYNPADEEIILPKYDTEFYRSIDEVRRYIDSLKRALSRGEPLTLDSSELSSDGEKAQELALRDSRFMEDIRDSRGRVLHNDIMTARPAVISVMDRDTESICRGSSCYQVTKYNFVTDTTTRAVVDIENSRVLQVDRFRDREPDISQRLKRVAEAIALNSPEVAERLGATPEYRDMSMSNVRGSINGSPCEDDHHLCVAPTFSYHDREKALWAIIDLTDMRLVVAKWAGLGKTTTPSCIDERTLQNRYIMERFCQRNNHHKDMGWEFKYRITGSDGLEVLDAKFNGKYIIKSAKIVDWHVAYRGIGEVDTSSSETVVAGRRVEYVDGGDNSFYFGYNDAMGCPMFSTSVVLTFNAPEIGDIVRGGEKVGFYITQDFRNPKWPMACNYRYESRFEFYRDGSFRVVGINIGRGCGDRAIYRPVMRIDLFNGGESFFKYENGDWSRWLKEGRDFQYRAREYYRGRYLYKITSGDIGYYIEPNRGQFDNSRGDNATIFATLYRDDEGAKDLLTLGSCCKLDEDGVEQFIDGDGIDGSDIVLWYVPRVQNDSREGHEYCWADTVLENGNLVVKEFPCAVGAKFVPIDGAGL